MYLLNLEDHAAEVLQKQDTQSLLKQVNASRCIHNIFIRPFTGMLAHSNNETQGIRPISVISAL